MIAHRVRSLMTGLSALLGGALAHAQSLPQVPDALKAPAGERVVLIAHASGSQIYVCAAGTDGKPQWTLKGPEASLRDDQGSLIGHHAAGPSWKLTDGSSVTGKMLAKAPSPDSASVPWLLLSVVSHDGKGRLEHVTTVQRLQTKGGQAPPPAKCTAAKPDAETWIPYTADYYFYAPAP